MLEVRTALYFTDHSWSTYSQLALMFWIAFFGILAHPGCNISKPTTTCTTVQLKTKQTRGWHYRLGSCDFIFVDGHSGQGPSLKSTRVLRRSCTYWTVGGALWRPEFVLNMDKGPMVIFLASRARYQKCLNLNPWPSMMTIHSFAFRIRGTLNQRTL